MIRPRSTSCSHTPGSTVCLLIALLGSGTVGCYTDPINREPTVKEILLEGDDPIIYRNVPRTYVANVTDDGAKQELTYRWGRAAACPEPAGDPAAAELALAAVGAEVSSGPRDQVQLTADSPAPFCVWVVAYDRYKATGTLARLFAPTNRDPMGTIELVAPPTVQAQGVQPTYPLFSKLRFTAKVDDPDGDDVELTWSITGPAGPILVKDCGPEAPKDVCFDAAISGTYEVAVAQSNGPFRDTETIVVAPDQPPCLTRFNPAPLPKLPRASNEPMAFSVEISDDGDPLPAPTGATDVHGALAWSVFIEGETKAPVPLALPPTTETYVIPAGLFRWPQSVRVTVEARDRAHSEPAGTCSDDGTHCELKLANGVTCVTRASWTVEVQP